MRAKPWDSDQRWWIRDIDGVWRDYTGLACAWTDFEQVGMVLYP